MNPTPINYYTHLKSLNSYIHNTFVYISDISVCKSRVLCDTLMIYKAHDKIIIIIIVRYYN